MFTTVKTSNWVYISDCKLKINKFLGDKARELDGNIVNAGYYQTKILPKTGSNQLKNGSKETRIYHGVVQKKMPWLLARTDTTDVCIDIDEHTRKSDTWKDNYDLLIAPLLKNVQIHFKTPYLPVKWEDDVLKIDEMVDAGICDHQYEEKQLFTTTYWACVYCGKERE